MKLKVSETKTKEVEVTFPIYTKYGESYYRCLSEENVMCASIYDFSYSIAHQDISLAFMEGYKKTTEKEFNKAYNKALSNLQL